MGRKATLCAALAAAAAMAPPVAGQAQPAAPAPPIKSLPSKGVLFISPAGEPFRDGADMTQSMRTWFDQADANHDGAVDRAEFLADHMRFFAILDRNKDGAVDSPDVSYYENRMFPELIGLQLDGQPFRRIGPRGAASKPVPRVLIGKRPPPRRGGAAFSVLNELHPLLVADTDADFSLSPAEWKAAAEARFDILDNDHDGRLLFRDLKLPPEPWPVNDRNTFNQCFNCEYLPLYQGYPW